MELKKWTIDGARIESAAYKLNWSAVGKIMDSEKPFTDTSSTGLTAIQHLLQTGVLPEDLPPDLLENPQFLQIVAHLEQLQEYSVSLANGNLEPELKLKGRMAGTLKTLQSNLRHLTWQTQRIASGDLTQQVRFMGEFSTAFNHMVTNLRQSQEILQQRAHELGEERREVEAANQTLQNRLEEIQALQAKLSEQAMRDPITGCFNRRYLEETLRREFSRAQREDYPLSLVMVDIDHFKQVNDTYGHPAGDAVLQALGILLRGHTRAGDIVCRYGGDEFLLVLPNMKLTDVLKRAEIWRAAFHDMEICYGELQMQSTISIGVASTQFHGTEADDVIRAVDKALYRAKNAGRDCVMPPE
jgi:diguanylate cyclase (GGDEF)-like protein